MKIKQKLRPERVKVEIQEIGKDIELELEEKQVSKITATVSDNSAKKEEETKDVSNEISSKKSTLADVTELPDISGLSIQEPSCFMEFERDFKRFKSDLRVLYLYIKVNLKYLLVEIGTDEV